MSTDDRTSASAEARRRPNRPKPVRYMVGADEALQLVLESACVREPREVPVEEANGLRLAEEIRSDGPQPAFDRAMMDGYAVRVADAGRTIAVAGEIAAGTAPVERLAPSSCVEIMTGAPCPPEAEAVVPREAARCDEDQVTLPRNIKRGQHIAPLGSECAAGQCVLGPGDLITPLAVATLASFGIRSVRATPKPRLGIITTGAELVSSESEPAAGQIRDSNGPMLRAMARSLGLADPVMQRAEDRLPPIVAALATVADCDIVLLSGGVSAGNHDLVPDAVLAYGAEIVFHKARQKPGKPLLLAAKADQLVFGLPGNPLACHFCFSRYVQAAVRRMSNHPTAIIMGQGRLIAPLRPDRGRPRYVPALVRPGPSAHDLWAIRPLPSLSSADVFHAHQANAYAMAPPGKDDLPAGHVLSFSLISHE